MTEKRRADKPKSKMRARKKTATRPETTRSDGLTDKQRVFIEQYLIFWNATEAAKRAGYSEKTAYAIGSENLRKPQIRQAIDRRLANMAMSSEEVLARLSHQASGDLSPFLSSNGEQIDLTTEEAHRNMALIKKFRVKKRHGGSEDNPWDEVDTEIELHDAQDALVHIGRYHGLFTERIKLESWQDEIVKLLKAGTLKPEDVIKELGADDARPILITAGQAISDSASPAEGRPELAGG